MLTLIAIPMAILLIVSAIIYFYRTGGELFGSGFQYKTFIAWRYILVYPPRVSRTISISLAAGVALLVLMWLGLDAGFPIRRANLKLLDIAFSALFTGVFVLTVVGLVRHSKPALYVFLVCTVIGAVCITVVQLWLRNKTPVFFGEPIEIPLWVWVLHYAGRVFAGIASTAWFLGCLRAYFTFFTTVPVFGVYVGTSALVMVLAVMSGFENDLRDKILGSNAHIQITREDGDFVDWREAKRRIDEIPGIVASTPYAVSEVVIAANNNGMSVIIKGIDPDTVGKVTDLVTDLEDKDAMRRLEPLVDDPHDTVVPQAPRPGGTVDPPPDDMPSGGDPIDFSVKDDPPPPADDAKQPDAKPDQVFRGSADFGGDALRITGMDDKPSLSTDPPPDDLVVTDEPPVDYSGSDDTVRAFDSPLEPSLSRRTQALPGILVGRELVKQTHLYTGEEVRVVSPLSDPSNPDATGTPIPFNRDYRVAGVFFTGMYEYDLKYVYVTLDSLQDFLDRGDAIDGIEVRITDADNTSRYVTTEDGPGLIREALGPGYRVVDWRELNRSLFSALKLEKLAMFVVLFIVILVASFAIVGNLIMVVVEKGRQIALLKTLGVSDPGMMQLFAIQGLLIGMIGTALGVTSGLLACWAGKRFGLPLDPNVYYIDRLPIHIDPASVGAAALAGVLISIAATFYPALLSARIRPSTGLRH